MLKKETNKIALNKSNASIEQIRTELSELEKSKAEQSKVVSVVSLLSRCSDGETPLEQGEFVKQQAETDKRIEKLKTQLKKKELDVSRYTKSLKKTKK